jgi:hypothetical protein
MVSRECLLTSANTYQYVPLRTFHAVLLANHVALSSTAYVREFRYAAREAEEEASTPET